jgi:hypothetical protein
MNRQGHSAAISTVKPGAVPGGAECPIRGALRQGNGIPRQGKQAATARKPGIPGAQTTNPLKDQQVALANIT